jgi:glutamate/tyrosine decarboxylase-like PLP-dependent enzyme
MRLAGRSGLQASMRADIALAEALYAAVDELPDFEAHTCSLSITTFRYAPSNLAGDPGEVARYLDTLNAAIVADVQKSGEAFISNAVLGGRYYMRACIVNFRTTGEDIHAVAGLIAQTARRLDRRMRPKQLAA